MATTITMPTESPLFAFSPSEISITTTNANQKVTFEFNSFSFVRYSGSDKKLVMPLSKILKSAWATEDIGDTQSLAEGAVRTSKLIKTFTLKVTPESESYQDVSITTVFGANQVGVSEPETETIYRFGKPTLLPLTVTQHKGNELWTNNGNTGNQFGKDYQVPLNATIIEFSIPDLPKKTFNIVDLPYCDNNIYLRWVNNYGQYKYFAFLYGESANESKVGDTFKKELRNLSATTNGLFKNQNQIIDIQSTPTIGLSVPTATYEQQKHLQSLETSIKCWRYLGNNQWVEVTAKVEPIVIDERWKQNKSVNLQIIMPELYLPTL